MSTKTSPRRAAAAVAAIIENDVTYSTRAVMAELAGGEWDKSARDICRAVFGSHNTREFPNGYDERAALIVNMERGLRSGAYTIGG